MASGFRANVFDPVLIVAQIIALQSCFYISFGLWIVIADSIGGIHRSIDQIFDYREFEGTYDGWLVMGASTLNACTGALALWWIVRRAKKSLDFAATVYIFHLVLCLTYGGFPRSLSWWLTNLVSFGITTIVSEWLCWRTELKAIPITGSLISTGAGRT